MLGTQFVGDALAEGVAGGLAGTNHPQASTKKTHGDRETLSGQIANLPRGNEASACVVRSAARCRAPARKHHAGRQCRRGYAFRWYRHERAQVSVIPPALNQRGDRWLAWGRAHRTPQPDPHGNVRCVGHVGVDHEARRCGRLASKKQRGNKCRSKHAGHRHVHTLPDPGGLGKAHAGRLSRRRGAAVPEGMCRVRASGLV